MVQTTHTYVAPTYQSYLGPRRHQIALDLSPHPAAPLAAAVRARDSNPGPCGWYVLMGTPTVRSATRGDMGINSNNFGIPAAPSVVGMDETINHALLMQSLIFGDISEDQNPREEVFEGEPYFGTQNPTEDRANPAQFLSQGPPGRSEILIGQILPSF